VDVADDVYIIKAEDAQKLLEPPRLNSLVIRPDHVVIKQGEQASFTCSGVDQYGQSFEIGTVSWSATGGTIEGGLYASAADGAAGLFTVRSEAAGLEAIAEVRVTSASEGAAGGGTGGGVPPRARMIQWQGDVPPQKWMNFYTKVLSRFAATPGLKLTVSFDVPAEGNDGQAKADEARAGLKELGLSGDVEVG
jgi:hypothetical protein